MDHFYNRPYYLLDEALTWARAEERCSEGNNGYLAAANSAEQFDFLRGLYDKYRNQSGSAVGAWIDGIYDSDAKMWRCHSNEFDTCPSDMPWSHGEPNRNDTEHCILVWYSRTDGVANYNCNKTMPAICATNRYFSPINCVFHGAYAF